MTSKANRIIVLDLEATCDENGLPEGQEQDIIEIGLCVIELRERTIRHRNNFLIFPERSEITPYCTKLTGIDKELIQKRAMPFEDAMNEVSRLYGRNSAWGSWGDFDRKLLKTCCERYHVPFPLGNTHYNLRHLYAMMRGYGKLLGLQRAIESERMEFEGNAHRAGDDAYNTARLMMRVFGE